MSRYRVSLGMLVREVDATNSFEAAHICGLGSGDIKRATIELIDQTPSVIDKLNSRIRTLIDMVDKRDAQIGLLQIIARKGYDGNHVSFYCPLCTCEKCANTRKAT